MYLDAELEFSDKQSVLVTSPSANVVDVRNLGDLGDNKIPLFVHIKEAYNNLVDITFQVQESEDEAFSAPVNLIEQTVPLAELTLGKRLAFNVLPHTSKSFLRMNYVVNAVTAPTTGKISAGIAVDKQTNY